MTDPILYLTKMRRPFSNGRRVCMSDAAPMNDNEETIGLFGADAFNQDGSQYDHHVWHWIGYTTS